MSEKGEKGKKGEACLSKLYLVGPSYTDALILVLPQNGSL
jgi:hypothetical protein